MKLFVLSLICVSFNLAAAASEIAPPEDQTTIMVYMNAKNDLDCAAVNDLKEMALAFPLRHITVVAEVGRHPFLTCTGEDDANVWKGTLFFQINKSLIPSPKQALTNVPDPPAANGDGAEVDMGNPQSLRNFVLWAERTYPARHYILVIWGHGHGFRLMNAPLRADDGPPPVRTNGYRAVSFDDDFQSFLFTHDFQEALKGTPKLDVLAFDTCLMAGIETAYAVRKLSAVMVGSEELEPDEGWNYTNVLGRLSRNRLRTPFSFGTSMVEAVRNSAGMGINPVTLSAIDLRKVNLVARQISHLADVMITTLGRAGQAESVRSQISSLRGLCKNYGGADGFHNPIDLIHFVDLLGHEAPTTQIKRSARGLLRTFRESGIVIDNYATIELRGKFGSNGLTIYFPPSQQWYNHDPDDHGEGYSKNICSTPSKHPVDFVCRLNWSSFLRVYFPPENSIALAAGMMK
jgi:hypothetical protein